MWQKAVFVCFRFIYLSLAALCIAHLTGFPGDSSVTKRLLQMAIRIVQETCCLTCFRLAETPLPSRPGKKSTSLRKRRGMAARLPEARAARSGRKAGSNTPVESRSARCLPRARTGQARSTREARTERARRRLRTSRKYADVNQRHKESTCIEKGRRTFARFGQKTEKAAPPVTGRRSLSTLIINNSSQIPPQHQTVAATASNRAVKALQRGTGRGSGRTSRACTPCSGCRQSPPVRPAQAWHTPGRAAGR